MKNKTASYVVQYELLTTTRDRKSLEKKFNSAKSIYNACLNECLKRLDRLKKNEEYSSLLKEKSSKKRNRKLKEIELSLNYSEYDMHKYVKDIRKLYSKHIGSLEAQKLATRSFQAVEKLHYHIADKVNFKNRYSDMSVENKSNNTGLRLKDNIVLWNDLKLKIKEKRNDIYNIQSRNDKTKYIRILKKKIRRKTRYFIQVIKEGIPPKKRNYGQETVGLDIGTSSVAIVSDSCVKLEKLSNTENEYKKLRRLDRKLERSKRINNPKNYNDDGTVKKGSKRWIYSNRYIKLKQKRKDLYRKLASKRKEYQEILANKIISLGVDIKVETMRFNALQKRAKETTINKKNGKINKKKRFGKSLINNSPSQLLTIIDRKLHYVGSYLKRIDTFEVKASQFNHKTKEFVKKKLSQRWNIIDNIKIQRDLYSAFLIQNVCDDLKSINVNLCNEKYDKFVNLHDIEINRLKETKEMRWLIA
ncbi:MAG: transposase [Finegoldia magna]|uniref:transposase n=1 Tax=Finegoldia magna TaxID=1260 RepID=UPI00290B5BEE|nr:transposase [Finegoldia magna]MDU4334204.1 transposase [Finegoldia magna]